MVAVLLFCFAAAWTMSWCVAYIDQLDDTSSNRTMGNYVTVLLMLLVICVGSTLIGTLWILIPNRREIL